ncbi:MAG TPA: DNA internalization-related competence protein ComEC/Rec2 [Thermoanaerobaculia bacterium]|nr:DNA internalization-related competence protein ComEC/Rec2 [Thermoanaerobaculia bacterium]
MDRRSDAPLLPLALAFALGASLSFRASALSLPLLAALSAAGLALGRRSGLWLSAAAAGALAALLAYGLPVRPEERIDPERPVIATGRIAGHWTEDEDGWAAPLEVERMVQGERAESARFTAQLRVPGESEPPPFGTGVRCTGYLRRSPGFANAVAIERGPWRLSLKSRVFLEVESEPGPIARLAGRLRRATERALAKAGKETTGKALARAFVLGDPSRIPPAWKRGLRWTGLSHLLSVSGVHVALAAALAFAAGSWLPRAGRLGLAAVVVATYLLLAGPLPALMRAGSMGLLALAALALERPPAARNGLGFALLLAVGSRPEVVGDLSFQLSTAATAGLLLLGPALERRWRFRPVWLSRSLAASLAAELAALPWALPRFHLLAPAAALLNLVAIPWAALALVGCFVWVGVAVTAPGLAARGLPLLDLLAAPLGWPARVPGAWRPGIPILVGPLGAAALAASLGLLLAWPARRRVRAVAILGGLVAAVALFAGRTGASEGDRLPALAMLDVGQGDAILLRDGGHAVLVDGGGWRKGDLGGRVLLPALLAEGVRRLDAVVMTHPDSDHCQGLVDVASYLAVAQVWIAPGWPRTGCAGELLALPGVTVREVSAGARGRVGRWRLAALAPAAGEGLSENDRSLVLAAQAFGRRALLTGDLEKVGELHLLDLPRGELRADVLKVGHHGSRSSSTGPFLDAVAPRLALVSVGLRNPYYHPSPEVLERLADRGARTLRTDRTGEIRLRFAPGGRIRVELPGTPKDLR